MSIVLLRNDGHNNYTQSAAKWAHDDGVHIAQELDKYRCWWWSDKVLAGMNAANKITLCYRNIRYTTTDNLNPVPPNDNMCLRNSAGDVVRAKNTAWDFLHAGDPLNQDFRNYHKAFFQEMKDRGFPGIFHDEGMPLVFASTTNPWAWMFNSQPINPRTGQVYTTNQYNLDCLDFSNWLCNQFPDMIHVANGFWSGNGYNNNKAFHDRYIAESKLDGFFCEGSWGNIYGELWNESDWRKSVNMLIDIQDKWLSKGKEFDTYTNTRGAATRPQSDGVGIIGWEQSALFQFCSALMAINRNGNNLSFHNCMSEDLVQDFFKIDIGVPIENYYNLDGSGIYTRKWSKVQPFVNPGIVTRTVDITVLNLVDKNKDSVMSITLPAKAGLLLYQIEQGGEKVLSFVNETNEAVAVWKRPIVVDEFVDNVPAGGSLDVKIDDTKDKLVIKEV